MIRWGFLAMLLSASVAQAALEVSPRPVARGTVAASEAPLSKTRPVARPAARPASVLLARGVSARPILRPKRLEARAMARQRERAKGSVCGVPELQGVAVGAVPGRGACGIPSAVRIREVSGVTLTQESLMNCETAKALKTWVDQSVKPTFRAQGGGLAKLRVAAHYVCKTRNSRPGAKLSEHGKGKAIDISAFIMRDGSQVTVAKGWRSKGSSSALKSIHKGACGPFGTVLGPNSDRFHQGHFHLDTARYRSGPYCR